MKRLVLAVLSVFMLISCSVKKNVLIIGDSISIGYTPFVKEALAKKANVVHNYGNARFTGIGIDSLDSWLGNTDWDVIHFNFGLHDLCYRTTPTNRDKVNGKLTTTLEDYESNLRKIVERLKKTDAKLIFATTTVVPEKEPGRFAEDVDKYNAVAVKVMKENSIQINDLHEYSKEIHAKFGNGETDVHYQKEGYRRLSKPVVKVIKKKF